jgi:hypothetical protein
LQTLYQVPKTPQNDMSREWVQWQSGCLACLRPWVQKKRKKRYYVSFHWEIIKVGYKTERMDISFSFLRQSLTMLLCSQGGLYPTLIKIYDKKASTVVHTYSSSYSGVWNRRIPWA